MADQGSPCPPPVVCPHSGQLHDDQTARNTFPTEAVLGGTLGGLSVILLAFIICAAVKHYSRSRRRHPSPVYRARYPTYHKTNPLAFFADPFYTYDVSNLPKTFPSYSYNQPDVYIARPSFQSRRHVHQRQAALSALLDPSMDSSDWSYRELRSPVSSVPLTLVPAKQTAGGGTTERGWDGIGGGVERAGGLGLEGDGDSYYGGGEPSIIAGSFVYHSPSNLPPHLAKSCSPHDVLGQQLPHLHRNSNNQSHQNPYHNRRDHLHSAGSAEPLAGDLSYDSFRNDHLYDSASRGIISSTLNKDRCRHHRLHHHHHHQRHHYQPPDFYL